VKTDFRKGQRQRLVALNNLTGSIEMDVPTGRQFGWEPRLVNATQAVSHYLDVAFIGVPIRELCFNPDEYWN
jgi:hypothetical protein